MKKFKWMGYSSDCMTKKETYEVTKLEGEKVYFINDKGQEDFFMSTNKKMVEIKD